jgi:hypothetical protein
VPIADLRGASQRQLRDVQSYKTAERCRAAPSLVGNLDTLRGSIDIACRIVEDIEERNPR